MILNIIVIALVALPTFFWATSGKGRGLYSAFLNLVCVLTAGAIAFGLWETVAHALLSAAKSGGLLDSIAWGGGLLIPFVISLALLRISMDTMLGANLHFDDTTNLVGGALFGLIAAFITAGVIVTSFQFMGTGRTFAGYSAVSDDSGNLIHDKPLWVPVDRYTVAFYEYLSLGAFRSATPLALAMPDAHQQGAMSRLVYVDVGGKGGTGRFGLKPEDFEIVGRYTVQGAGATLFADVNQPERTQVVKLPDGSSPPAGSTIEGIAVRLRSGAVEKSGSQVIFGAGQARLIIRKPNTDDAMGVQPIAIIASPEGGGGYARFRLASANIFVPTVGGASENIFTFEFVVPAAYAPDALILKNARKKISTVATFDHDIDGWEERDNLLASGDLFTQLGIKAGGGAGNIDASSAVTITIDRNGRGDDIRAEAGLPNNFIVTKSNEGSLSIEADGQSIIGGSHTFEREQLENRGVERSLRRDRFAGTRTTGVVQVSVASKEGLSVFGAGIESADTSHSPLLLSSTGETFQPVGFINEAGELVTISFTPNKPLRSIRNLPIQLSRIKHDQILTLIYRPTKGAKIVGFVILDAKGDGTQIATFEPPLEIRR